MDGREESPCPPSLETLTPSSEGASVEDLVMSEVHLGCPPNFSGAYVSRFIFSLPPVKDEPTLTHQVVSLDKDGDLVITRRSRIWVFSLLLKHLDMPDMDEFVDLLQPNLSVYRRLLGRSNGNYVVNIQHSISSSIPSVGLQVWRAELILADFLLHKMEISSEFKGIVALELGAGTGLVGILLARVAKTVFLTDHGDEVLGNCADNVHLNSELFHSQASVHVRELDWKACWPPKVVKDSVSQRRYAWTSAEVEELQRASLIVAADVIYSDDLTDAFFNILEKLMKQIPEKVVYLALEKRYNFTLDDLNVVANGYSRFRSYLRDDAGEFDDQISSPLPCFVGKCIDLTQIPQYLREYKRGNDVELWQIKYDKLKA